MLKSFAAGHSDIILLRFLICLFLMPALWLRSDLCFGSETSGPRAPWTTSALHGTPTVPHPYRIRLIFPELRFTLPTSLQEIPDTGRMLVTEMSGRILTFRKDDTVRSAELALDLSTTTEGEISLYSAILHPDFSRNHQIFVCTKHPAGGLHSRVSRFVCSVSADSLTIDPATEEVVITWPAGGHNGGCLQFGIDGMLYISTGDGSGPNPPDSLTTGQNVADLLGAVLRIDVDDRQDDKLYSVPSDNPFVSLEGACPEVYAYGLRNPWKFGIDPRNGDIFVADNGWETWEMIHRLQPGSNCGWPVMEGRALLRKEVAVGPTPIIPPAWDHPHSEANSVIGGPVYRGSRLPELDGSFIYGDYITGTIWAGSISSDKTSSVRTLTDTDQRIIAFAEGSAGELFVLDYDLSGQIYELIPNDVEDRSATFPRLLSQTGLFQSVNSPEPAPGVVTYSVIAERWTDGAAAQRWVAIPDDGQIRLSSDTAKDSTFPEGTVFVKQLSAPAAEGISRQRLETQILHLENGTWNPYAYVWNSEQTDAVLAGPGGAVQSVQWPDAEVPGGFSERTWRTGAVNECRLCHNSGPGFVLGFVAAQLSGQTSGTSAADQQLTALTEQRVIETPPVISNAAGQDLVDPHDTSHSLTDRARSYLHANCSMCHHKGGNAIVSFYLKRDLSFDQMNTDKGTGIGTFGIHDARIIAPGDPYRSLLLYRMSKLGYARMPYIGSQVVDSRGVLLIEQWIRSLPAAEESRRSGPLVTGSADAGSLEVLTSARSAVRTEREAAHQLLSSTEGALALQLRMHAGSVPPQNKNVVISAAAESGSDTRGLFDQFIPEALRRKTLGHHFDPQSVLSLTGDAQRGKLIYTSDTARCRNCHHLNDASLSVGPALVEISRKYAVLQDLLQHVVAPSQKIDDRYAAWLAVTDSGQTVTGLLERESAAEIVLRSAERRSVTLQRNELEELHRSPKSLMPEGVLADLTAQEAADLMAFIRSSVAEPVP